MKKVNFKKHPVTLKGNLPETGKPAPSFSLVKTDLATISLEEDQSTKVLSTYTSAEELAPQISKKHLPSGSWLF